MTEDQPTDGKKKKLAIDSFEAFMSIKGPSYLSSPEALIAETVKNNRLLHRFLRAKVEAARLRWKRLADNYRNN